MNKKTKIIATSVLSIIMCSSMIAGATYALFTSESTTNIAITSGKVSIDAGIDKDSLKTFSAKVATDVETVQTENAEDDSAEDDDPVEYIYDENSNKYVYEEKDNLTFANGGYATFNDDDDLYLYRITPGDKVTFNINVKNSSNVAVQYRTLISSTSEGDQNLIAALKSSFTLNNSKADSDKYKISNNNQTNFSGVISYSSQWIKWDKQDYTKEETATISVEIYLPIFVTKDYNNLDTTLTFAIEAVQGNAATSGEENFEFENYKESVVEENRTYDIVYDADGNKSITITSYTPDGNGKVDIPAQINDIDVTEIADNAFAILNDEGGAEFNKTIKSVKIPDTVTEIGERAFDNCVSLEEVTLGENVKTIGKEAFYNCTSLKTIKLPEKLEEIKDQAFQSSGLTSISFPESVKKIGFAAFAEVALNGELVLPATLTDIGEMAFYGCNGLTKVMVSEGIKSLPYGAFYDCENLATVQLPSTLTEIGDAAFYATALTTLDIPNNLTTIGSFSFYNCEDLESINLSNSLTSIGYMAFYECAKLTSITLPASLKEIGIGAFANENFDGITITYNGTVDQWKQIKVVGDIDVVEEKLLLNVKDLTIMNITETTRTGVFLDYYSGLQYLNIDPYMTIEEYNQSTIDEWDDYAANSAECYISPFYCFMEAKGGTYSGKTYVSVTCNKETDEGNDTIEYKYENGEFKIYINNELYVEEESDT